MVILFACPCGTEIEAMSAQVGRQVACPACRSLLTVPKRPVSRDATTDGVDLGIEIDRPAFRGARKTITRRGAAANGWCVGAAGMVLGGLLTSLAHHFGWAVPTRSPERAQAELFPAGDVGRADPPRRRPDTLVAVEGGTVRLETRDFAVDRVPPLPTQARPLALGDMVVLADDTDVDGPRRDVVACVDLFALRLTRAADFVGKRRRLAELARTGRVFAVPRGSIATVLDLVEGPGEDPAAKVAAHEGVSGTWVELWISRTYLR